MTMLWRKLRPGSTTLRLPHIVLLMLIVGGTACQDLSKLAGTQSLPAGTTDPNSYHTADGAMALYRNTIAAFQGYAANRAGAFLTFVFDSGLLTDELLDGGLIGSPTLAAPPSGFDARILPAGGGGGAEGDYTNLQAIRNDASEGIGALASYDPTASPALRGHLFALQGYAEIFLADLFCSGIPLSTLNFDGDYTYARGDSTDEVYRHAIAAFNTALTLSSDSVRIATLAWLGKGRAYLDLGQYDSAAAAAAHVPDMYAYSVAVDFSGYNLLGRNDACGSGSGNSGCSTAADRQGQNGMPFISSGDPRTAAMVFGANGFGAPLFWPVKYGGATPGIAAVPVADWIEARLIQAEASLHGVATGRGDWLTQLNALRATAGVPGLSPLSDPGPSLDDSARVSLIFQERAYWLYLTGHRQGDLRRLVRQYHRTQAQVYPTGPFPGSASQYGASINAPVPSAESANNLYHGCFNRGA